MKWRNRMDDEMQLAPDTDEVSGWVVLDPDGNVIDSGPVVALEAAADAGPEEQEI